LAGLMVRAGENNLGVGRRDYPRAW
jgi:hypothetical protein